MTLFSPSGEEQGTAIKVGNTGHVFLRLHNAWAYWRCTCVERGQPQAEMATGRSLGQ